LFTHQALYHPPELPVLFEPIEMWSTLNDATCTYVVTVDELSVSSWDWIGLYKVGGATECDIFCLCTCMYYVDINLGRFYQVNHIFLIMYVCVCLCHFLVVLSI